MNDIPEILLAVRKRVGLTQKEFAGKIGLKQNTYSMLESGKNRPTLETIYSIIKEFGVDANLFFEEFGPNLISNSRFRRIAEDDGKNENDLVTGRELDEIIGYKLGRHLNFYILGISYHVRKLQEQFRDIPFDEKHYAVEENYIKKHLGDVIQGIEPGYTKLSIPQKIDLIRELDEATTQYLDNIWLITSQLFIHTYNEKLP